MAALLVAMSVMAIVLSTAMPVYQTVARREREAELIFRGEQYARAIGKFQQKYGNALPPDVDVLIDQRFLRKKYKDPITGGDFQFLGPGSSELAGALSAPPPQTQDALRRGTGARGASSLGRAQTGGLGAQGVTSPLGRAQTSGSGAQSGMQSGFTPVQRGGTFMPSGAARGAQTAAGRAASAEAAGGILAVASKSNQTSMRLYNGKNKYNEWVFMAVQSSLAAGGPPGSGGQTPGGRGGRAGGRGGIGPGRSGTGAPPPSGPRGRGGFSPMGTPR
jgi:type II secretory pathway pseudopilin PulG